MTAWYVVEDDDSQWIFVSELPPCKEDNEWYEDESEVNGEIYHISSKYPRSGEVIMSSLFKEYLKHNEIPGDPKVTPVKLNLCLV